LNIGSTLKVKRPLPNIIWEGFVNTPQKIAFEPSIREESNQGLLGLGGAMSLNHP